MAGTQEYNWTSLHRPNRTVTPTPSVHHDQHQSAAQGTPSNEATARTSTFENHLSPAKFPRDDRPFIPRGADHELPPAHDNHGQYQQHETSGILPSPNGTEASLESGSSSSGSQGSGHDQTEKHNQPAATRPAFNPERYPGYDEHGNHRGLAHLSEPPRPKQKGDYYTPRTYAYPGARAGEDEGVLPIMLENGISQETLASSINGVNPYQLTRDPLEPLSGFTHSPLPGMPGTQSASSNSRPALPQLGYVSKSPAMQAPSFHNVDVMAQYQQNSFGPQIIATASPPSVQPAGSPPKDIAELMGLEPGTPLSLHSLRDPDAGQKPEYSYPTLIKLAIHDSPKKALTLQEIYDVIERRFPWFATCDKKNASAWRNSIRHTLSLLAVFQKKPRPITEPGKGHYWYLDFSKGTGNKRVRKRNKKPTKAQLAARAAAGRVNQEDEDDAEEEASDSDELIDPVLQAQSRRGIQRAGSNNSSQGGSVSRSQHAATARSRPYPAQNTAASAEASTSQGQIQNQYHDTRSGGQGLDTMQWYENAPPQQQLASTSLHHQLQQYESQKSYRVSSDPNGNTSENSRRFNDAMVSNGGYIRQGDNDSTFSPHVSLAPLRLAPTSFQSQSQRSIGQYHLDAPSQQRDPAPRFGQPTFGASSAPGQATSAYAPSNTLPTPLISANWANSAASSFTGPREPVTHDRNAPVQLPAPRPGIEVVNEGGLPRARRVTAPAAVAAQQGDRPPEQQHGGYNQYGSHGQA